jgi:hypothetical protein
VQKGLPGELAYWGMLTAIEHCLNLESKKMPKKINFLTLCASSKSPSSYVENWWTINLSIP